VPHLLQYVSNGNYYGRIKIRGKVIRESLKTQVWTTAKLRPADSLKRQPEARAVFAAPKSRQSLLENSKKPNKSAYFAVLF
jgi:hypothetical protein